MASSSSTTVFLICFILALDLIVAQKVSDILKGQQQKIFGNFKAKYGKKYKDDSQQLYRNLIVFKNANLISNHNLKGNKPYTLGMNQFSDLTEQEFILKYTSLMVPDKKVKDAAKLELSKADLTQNLCQCDISKKNKISQIEKSQGNIKNQLVINALNKANKKMNKLGEINKSINQFQSKISNLPAQDYEVTMTKIRQDAAAKGGNPNNNKTGTTTPVAPTSSSSSQSNGPQGNLKKNNPKGSTPTPTSSSTLILPSSLSTQQIQQKLDAISSPTYTGQLLGSVGMTTLNGSSTIQTNQVRASFSNLTGDAQESYTIEQVLLSLGDNNITQAGLNSSTINVTTALLGSTTNTTTTTTTNTTATATNTTNSTEFNVDWSNYTGGVRFQGICGSCYSLAAVANVQALLYIYSIGFPLQLSAQQIIDCSNNTFTFGCDGGYLEGSYLFMKTNGVTTEYIYPYRSGTSGTVGNCRTLNGPFKITSFRNLPENDCLALKTELKKKPVSLGVASNRMQFYQSGIFNDCTSQVDHAVLLVGYNSTKGWKIKNTWGSSWGQSGYAWIQDGNTCGICSIPTSPTIASQPVS